MAGASDKEPGRFEALRTAGLYATVPLLLIVAPLLGALIGRWLDVKLRTTPWLLILGLVLGFVAAGREVYRIYRRIEAEEAAKKQRSSRRPP